jgi:hypothetical protein
VCIDDIRKLQPALVGGLVELEIDRPYVVRAQGSHPSGRVETHTPSLSLDRDEV